MKHFFCLFLSVFLLFSLLVFPVYAAELPNNAKPIFTATSVKVGVWHDFGLFDFDLVDGDSYYIQITGPDFNTVNMWSSVVVFTSGTFLYSFSGINGFGVISPSATGSMAPYGNHLMYRWAGEGPLTVTVGELYEPTGFLTEIGSVFVMVFQWVGAVMISLVTPGGDLYPLLIVCVFGIAVSIVLFAAKFIRR